MTTHHGSKNTTAFRAPILAAVLAVGAIQVHTAAQTAAQNPSAATPREVLDKVHQAAAILESDGRQALDELSSPDAGFRWKDTYIFVVDCRADRVLLNLAFPERVGGDIKKHTDYAGYVYGKELCRTAVEDGGGWVEYTWLEPGGTTPKRKVSYVLDVPGQDVQLGAGVYDDTSSLDDLRTLSDAFINRSQTVQRGNSR